MLSSYEPLRQEIRLALSTEVDAFCALASTVTTDEGAMAVPGLAWRVDELVAHVDSVMLRGHADLRRSKAPAETSDLNALALTEVTERDVPSLAEAMRTHAALSLDVFDRIPADVEVDFHAGTRAPVMALWAYVVAELMVHRHDLGAALGRPQILDPDRFGLTGYAAAHVLSAWAEPAAVAGDRQTWAYGFPQGQVLSVVVGEGSARLDFPEGEAAISVDDPTEFLLTFPFRRLEPVDPQLAALVAAFQPL